MSLTKTREIFAMLKREKSAGSRGMVYSCTKHEKPNRLILDVPFSSHAKSSSDGTSRSTNKATP